jgi:hypothetical protein
MLSFLESLGIRFVNKIEELYTQGAKENWKCFYQNYFIFSRTRPEPDPRIPFFLK